MTIRDELDAINPDMALALAKRVWMRRGEECITAKGPWIASANAPMRPPERVTGDAVAAIAPSPLAAYTVHASHGLAEVG